jgi:hypothetical protein
VVPLALHRAFYEASAQIIPVLMLVAFVGEGRIVRGEDLDPQRWRTTAMMAIGAMLLMLLGELAALRVLGQGHDSYLLRGLTSLAIVYGFLFIAGQVVKLALLSRPTPLPPRQFEALGRLFAAAILLVTFGSLAIIDPGFPMV